MVDLPFGRCAVLAGLAVLAGCSTTPRAIPQASNAQRQTIRTALQSGDHAALTRAALVLARMGGGMSDHGFDSFASSLDDATLAADHSPWFRANPATDRRELLHRWFQINNRLEAIRSYPTVAEVPSEFRLVEGIAYDQPTGRLFAGTVVEGRLAYLEKGIWHEVPLGFPRSGLFGMAIDSKRRLLWIATGAAEETAVRSDPMAGLIAVDLDRLAVVQRVPVSGNPGVPGDVTVGPDGTVYLSDGMTGALLHYRPGAAAPVDLVPPGSFKSAQGMAVSRDGKLLYVADYATGLWIVRLRDGRIRPIGIDRPVMLDGIDGVVKLPWQNALIVTQNGTAPRRILKLSLSPGGSRIVGIDVRQVVAAGAGDPTLATLNGHDFWFVGDGQWERYGPGGDIKDGKLPRPTPIVALAADDIVVTAR